MYSKTFFLNDVIVSVYLLYFSGDPILFPELFQVFLSKDQHILFEGTSMDILKSCHLFAVADTAFDHRDFISFVIHFSDLSSFGIIPADLLYLLPKPLYHVLRACDPHPVSKGEDPTKELVAHGHVYVYL